MVLLDVKNRLKQLLKQTQPRRPNNNIIIVYVYTYIYIHVYGDEEKIDRSPEMTRILSLTRWWDRHEGWIRACVEEGRRRRDTSVDCIGLLAEKTRARQSGTVFLRDARLSRPGPRKNGMKCIGRKLAPPPLPLPPILLSALIYIYIYTYTYINIKRINRKHSFSPPKDRTDASGGWGTRKKKIK